MAVTTALCADRVAAAAPAVAAARPHVGQVAGRLVNRLTERLCRAVAGTLPSPLRRHAPAGRVAPSRPAVRRDEPLPVHPPLSPFQFRLPPPLA